MAGTYVRYAGEKHPGGAPAVPPTFKVRVASRSERAPRAPGGPAINSRDSEPSSLHALSFSLSLLLIQLRIRTRSTTLGESNAPAGTRRHHANLQVERGAHTSLLPLHPPPPLSVFQAPTGNRTSTWPSVISPALVPSFSFGTLRGLTHIPSPSPFPGKLHGQKFARCSFLLSFFSQTNASLARIPRLVRSGLKRSGSKVAPFLASQRTYRESLSSRSRAEARPV